MLRGFAHAAVCVPDVDAATRWYAEVLGMTVLSPPFLIRGDAIERDMGELIGSPAAVKAAIVGWEASDDVIELIEYPEAGVADNSFAPTVTRRGLTHLGLLCDDVTATRSELEAKGVQFLVSGVADVAGLRTTWCCDPWGTVFILLQKSRPALPYWHQYGG
jgi:catechol 2,3-dioxygenase-like lactoylglutathione lyase family enzyme